MIRFIFTLYSLFFSGICLVEESEPPKSSEKTNTKESLTVAQGIRMAYERPTEDKTSDDAVESDSTTESAIEMSLDDLMAQMKSL